jgi:hypothetical protein
MGLMLDSALGTIVVDHATLSAGIWVATITLPFNRLTV